jgi:hypothetical protein
MSDNTATAGVVTRTHPVRYCTLLPAERGLPNRVMFRIDEVLSTSEIQDIVETANDIVGVMCFKPLADQQVTPHTMFVMEVNGLYDEREVHEVTDLFYNTVNAGYIAQQHQQVRTLHFSASR